MNKLFVFLCGYLRKVCVHEFPNMTYPPHPIYMIKLPSPAAGV